MRVLFISVNTEEVNMPTLPLGLACVATATQRAGHEVNLVDLTSKEVWQEVLQKAISKFQPDIIGIGVRNIDDQVRLRTKFLLDQVKEVINACRALTGVPVVLGGAGYSIYPESVLVYLGADMGVKGEGEAAFSALLDYLERGIDPSAIPGLCLPGKGIKFANRFTKNLDELPFPDEQLWLSPALVKQDVWIPLQTRRGCPMNCSYCSSPLIEGRARRVHSPEGVVEMLGRYVKAGFSRFYFTDNTFNIPSSYAAELCSRMLSAGLKISWMCILYPWEVKESLIKIMALAGCHEVSLGFESGNEGMLSRMNKKFGPREVRSTSLLLQRHGIRQMGFLLLGGPGETRTTVEESLEFADSLPLDAVRVTAGVRIYPHTTLARQAVEEGVVSSDDDLLHPRFYLAQGLEGWLDETLAAWMSTRPNWFR